MRSALLLLGLFTLFGCGVENPCPDVPKLKVPDFPRAGQQIDIGVTFDTDPACIKDPNSLTLTGLVNTPTGDPQTPQVTFGVDTSDHVHFSGHILFTPAHHGSYYVRGIIEPSVREFGVTLGVLQSGSCDPADAPCTIPGDEVPSGEARSQGGGAVRLLQ